MTGKQRHHIGRQRLNFKRDIQKILDDAGMTQASFARLVGLTKQAVSATLNGTCHSPTVLDKLRELGVPEKFLCDPRNSNSGRAA